MIALPLSAGASHATVILSHVVVTIDGADSGALGHAALVANEKGAENSPTPALFNACFVFKIIKDAGKIIEKNKNLNAKNVGRVGQKTFHFGPKLVA